MSAKTQAIAGGVIFGVIVAMMQAAQKIRGQGKQITAGGLVSGTASNLMIAGGMIMEIVSGARGIRNNNPGNIRLGASWQGMAAQQTDGSFIQFRAPEYGIRAMNKILNTYAGRGLNTVRKIISAWAPPSENNTAAYVAAVAAHIGVSADSVLTMAHRRALIEAIIKQENGVNPYLASVIDAGIAMV